MYSIRKYVQVASGGHNPCASVAEVQAAKAELQRKTDHLVQLKARIVQMYRGELNDLIRDRYVPLGRSDFMHRLKHVPKGPPCEDSFRYLRYECPNQDFEFCFLDRRDVFQLHTGREVEAQETEERFDFKRIDASMKGHEDQFYKEVEALQRYVNT